MPIRDRVGKEVKVGSAVDLWLNRRVTGTVREVVEASTLVTSGPPRRASILIVVPINVYGDDEGGMDELYVIADPPTPEEQEAFKKKRDEALAATKGGKKEKVH